MCDVGGGCPCTLGMSTLIGTRPDQQDSIYGQITGDSLVAVICDGMGGLEAGALASQSAVRTFAEDYEKRDRSMSIPKFLKLEANEMDMVVSELKAPDGHSYRAGTTVAAAVVQGSSLYWLSVGDSRIYIVRGSEIMAVNRDHNYRLRLSHALKHGDITPERYAIEDAANGDALISFIGMGGVRLMDVNMQPFPMEQGDVVVVCSDGLYRALDDENIVKTLREYLPDAQQAAEMLAKNAVLTSLESQDNTTVAVIQYRGEEPGD